MSCTRASRASSCRASRASPGQRGGNRQRRQAQKALLQGSERTWCQPAAATFSKQLTALDILPPPPSSASPSCFGFFLHWKNKRVTSPRVKRTLLA
ncbi:hypothetical protein GOP47_0026833 [Adiantum capillus-veneris]|nr:hypothetical protein GOP47_0026833 [Adiantum capillus-veneris]